MVGFLITNGGPHPADKWAEIMVSDIMDLIQIDAASDTAEARAARRAKRDISIELFDLFEDALVRVQSSERTACAKNRDRVSSRLDPTPHTPKIVSDFDALMEATPFAAHFAQDAVKEHVRNVFRQRFASVMNVERKCAETQGV